MSRFDLSRLRSHPMFAGLTIIFGQGFGQAISFARNVLLARLLVPEQFGIAVTFITVGTFFQMAADLAFDKYLIRNAEKDPAQVRDAIHFLNILRGVLTALAVLAISPLVARMFGAPDYWPVYGLLALAPLFKGFEHLDYKLAQRDIRMVPEMLCLVGSQAFGFVVTIGLAWLMESPVAIVIGLNAQYFVFTVISHLLADTRYAAHYDGAMSRRVLAFGLPLVGSGWLSFVGMQGDRIVVGSLMGVRELGAYATVTLILTSVNALLMAGIGSVAFPILARAQGDSALFADKLHRYAAVAFALVCAVFVPLSVCVTFASRLLFGAQYHVDPQVACQVGIAVSLAFYRAYLATALLAMGRSRAILMANTLRASGVLAGALAVAAGRGLVTFTALMVLAEVVSCLVSLRLVTGALSHGRGVHVRYLALCGGMLAVAYVAATRLPVTGPFSIAIAACLALAGLAILYAIEPLCRAMVHNAMSSARGNQRADIT
ncbi:oligosaccharide flippase family protein [Novosphingobium sp. YJ-S2-02]|uniref:Oligosaccharide flippase family protein n=1 Tax=Novosphingobium aureum TaxID=2792964 RepID=A0A931HF94_9SPHN|nr:oligosaccharide flippase family protein [Novosphingobium aureum]MBH0114333.1 oligosaccharide flippase family protein [Novosphingobium aureum]